MLNALDELETLSVMLNEDEDSVEEYAIYYYLAVRLKPLIGHYGITEADVNEICSCLADNYFDYDYSLDYMIAAVYNYCKAIKQRPKEDLLTTGIAGLLENFGEGIEYV